MKRSLIAFFLVLSCLSLCLMLAPIAAHALTFSYKGVVSNILEMKLSGGPDWNYLANAGFSIGDEYTIDVVFDEETSNSSSSPEWGHYFDSIESMNITNGSLTATGLASADSSIMIHDGQDVGKNDSIGFNSDFSLTPTIGSPVVEDRINVGFIGSYDTFSGVGLPLTPVNPEDFTRQSQVRLNFYETEWLTTGYVIISDLELVAPQPIPDASTLLLLGSGLLGVVGIRRKFKK